MKQRHKFFAKGLLKKLLLFSNHYTCLHHQHTESQREFPNVNGLWVVAKKKNLPTSSPQVQQKSLQIQNLLSIKDFLMGLHKPVSMIIRKKSEKNSHMKQVQVVFLCVTEVV